MSTQAGVNENVSYSMADIDTITENSVTTYPIDKPIKTPIPLAAFTIQAILGVLIILLNSIILLIFKRGKLHDSIHILLTNLAVADILFGFAFIGRFSAIIVTHNFQYVCYVYIVLALISTGVSITIITALTYTLYSYSTSNHGLNMGGSQRSKFVWICASIWFFWCIYATVFLVITKHGVITYSACHLYNVNFNQHLVACMSGACLFQSLIIGYLLVQTAVQIRMRYKANIVMARQSTNESTRQPSPNQLHPNGQPKPKPPPSNTIAYTNSQLRLQRIQ